jgi:glycosyltransferase involved in cell wall biosynthesis
MANGLPVVVTDWNGYPESVQEGVEGFKIPVTMPSRGAGRNLAEEYLINQLILLRHIDCDKGVGMIISGHEYRDSLSRH